MFDEKFTWSFQVSYVCNKMSYYLFWINSYRKCLNTVVIKLLVGSLVIFHLDYAQVNQLQYLQNWGIQYCSLCVLHHYYSTDLEHTIPLDTPITIGTQHSQNTQCCSAFANTSRCRLSTTQQYFRFKAAEWWNHLPEEFFIEEYHNFAKAVHSHPCQSSLH